MGIFDPKVDTEVSYQQPLSVPEKQMESPLFALAEIGVGAASEVFKTGGSGSGSGGSDGLAMQQFQETIMMAQSARSNGDSVKANRLESTATLNLQRQGLKVNDDVKAAYSAITGRPGDELMFSREQLLEQEMMESPAYQTALQATYASDQDLSMEERHQKAMARVVRQQSQATQLMDDNLGWTEGKRDAFSSAVNDFSTSVLGTINEVAKQKGFVDQEILRVGRLQWEETKSALYNLRPEGVSDNQWSQVEDQIDRVDAQFELVEEMSSAEGIEGQMAAQLAQGVMEKEDWTVGMRVASLNLLKNPDALSALGVVEVKESVEALLTENFNLPGSGTQEDPETGEGTGSALPKAILDNIGADDSEKSLKRARSIGKLLGTTDQAKLNDPAYRNDFLKATHIGFEAMNKIGGTDRRYLSAEGITQVFNGEIVAGLKAIAKVDPVQAEAAFQKGFEALDKQFAIAQGQLSNSLSGTALRLDPEGKLVLNREVLLERTSPEMFARIERAAEDHYGGDLMALLKDRGMKPTLTEFEGGGFRQGTAINLPPEVYEGLGDLSTIQQQLRAVNTIDKKRMEFRQGLNLTRQEDTTPQAQTLDLDTSAQVSEQIMAYSGVEPRGILDVAQSQLGLNENDQREAVTNFLKAGGQNVDPATTAWCAAFVNSTLKQVGLNGTDQLNARSFLDWGTEVTEPKVGDVVVLWRDNPDSWKGHVGFFKGYDDNGDILILGGNQSDSVNVKSYSKDKLLGFRRPPGQQETGEKTISRNLRSLATEPESFLPEGYNTAPQETPETASLGVSEGTQGGQMPEAGAETPVATQETTEVTEQPETRDSGRAVAEQKMVRTRNILKRVGVDESTVPRFNSEEEARKAIDGGELSQGDFYIINGELEVVEES